MTCTNGPKIRLDFKILKKTNVYSHGIIGQSYYLPKNRNGKVDIYPQTGEYRTKSFAEGAIKGSHKDYIMKNNLATD